MKTTDERVDAYAWRAIHDRRGKMKAMLSRFHRDARDDAAEIANTYIAAGREPTDTEVAQLEALVREKQQLRVAIMEAGGRDPNEPSETSLTSAPGRPTRRAGGSGSPIVAFDSEGRPVRLLAPNEKLVALHDAGDPTPELGEIVRGMVTGEWSSQELKASAGSSTTGGGLTLAPLVSAQILDLARAKARVVQAGARTIQMEARELRIARVATAPTAGWRAENKAIPVGDFTFDGVTLNARTLGVIAKAPVELVEDARNLGTLIESVLSEVIALEFDRAALLGTGSAEEPLGVRNTPGVLTITAVGTPLYDDFVDATRDIRLQNGEPTGTIMSPRDVATLEKLRATAGDNQYLIPPKSYTDLEKFSTSQIPTNLGAGTNESLIFVGDWSQLWIGVRTQITIEASRQASDPVAGDSAFGNLQVWFRAYIRADVAVVRPKFFDVLSGVL